jgi:ferredoxin
LIFVVFTTYFLFGVYYNVPSSTVQLFLWNISSTYQYSKMNFTFERRIFMIRRIIQIDQKKCNGCGLCANACHEGAIGIVDGKAVLLRDDYCDGFGDCLPSCPMQAIQFVEREAAAYDEAAVAANMQAKKQNSAGGCPGSRARQINHRADSANEATTNLRFTLPSQLRQWPVQIKLVPIKAPYFEGANLLIAADCTAYAYGNFHQDFIRNHVTLIGCPKLDSIDYSEKLTRILTDNNIKSVTIVRMEVPCCGGIQHMAETALKNSGKFIPWQVVTIGIDGTILDQ